MGYIVYVKSYEKRFEQWTGKVHKTRASAIIEMNKGKETYKNYPSSMKDVVKGAVWVVRKVGGRGTSPLGSNLRMPKFRF